MRLVEGRDAGSRKTDNSLPSWPAVGYRFSEGSIGSAGAFHERRDRGFRAKSRERLDKLRADFRGRFATPSNEVFGPRQRAKKVAQKRT
jgi:hypothetical protein